MSNTSASDSVGNGLKARPLSPHLSIYRPIPTMVMSIAHRITGMVLYAGTLLVAWWLIAAAVGVQAYASAAWFLSSPLGLLILFGYTFALLHHMLGGIRHFIWDTGHGLEKHTARTLSIATLAGSVTLTLLLWGGWLLGIIGG